MVDVGDSSLQADSQHKSIGLVWGGWLKMQGVENAGQENDGQTL